MTATTRGHNPDETATKRRWRTPPALFATLNAEYGFGLDAAAEPGANLCPAFLSPALDCLTTPWADHCATIVGKRVAWFNPPWGPRFTACPVGCAKDHSHHAGSFAGTGAFVERAIEQAPTLDGAVLLLPTAPDTSWWQRLFERAALVRLLPRVAFLDGVTGIPANAPPGAGVTVFALLTVFRGDRRVVLADTEGVIRA